MRVRIEWSGRHGDDELRSLYRWLRDDRELRATTRVTDAGDGGGTDTMGGGIDAVEALISVAAGVGQFAVACAAWRDARRPAGTVTVVVTGADAQAADAVRRALGLEPPGEDGTADDSRTGEGE